MAKNKNKTKKASGTTPSSKSNSKNTKKQQKKEVQEEKIQWEDIMAMSDSDDDGDDRAMELNKNAKSLRQAITSGKFDGLLASLKKNKKKKDDDEEDDSDDEDFEEDVLDGSSSEQEEEDDEEAEAGDSDKEQVQKEEEDDEQSEEESDDDDEKEEVPSIKAKKGKVEEDEQGSDSDEQSEDEEVDDEEQEEEEEEEDDDNDEDDRKIEKYKTLEENNNTNSKALAVVTKQLMATHSKLPWAETFVVVPPTPLPFGEKGDLKNNPLDIHDDLKREVAFYNTALEAVNEARKKCNDAGVPFSRPEDFFAEMVKTDGTYYYHCVIVLHNLLNQSLTLLYPNPFLFYLQITWPRSKIVLSLRTRKLKLLLNVNLTRNRNFVQKNPKPIDWQRKLKGSVNISKKSKSGRILPPNNEVGLYVTTWMNSF